ncbi:MAG TPA: DUF5916 domain-containing protein [Gemmatimonadales bacterium]|nr:DUF5916 domain-containing protein [Gemmatimonadales bacterium]
MSRPVPFIRCSQVAILALLCWGAPLWAQTTGTTRTILPAGTTLTIPRVDRPPALADFLAGSPGAAGAAGAGLRVTEFRQREPGDGTPVSQATTAYLSYDDANLYVVFVCSDDPAKVRANIARRESISNDDQVVVYLDTFRDRKRAYFFAANPLGVQEDGIRTEGQDEDKSFDAVWSSDGKVTDSGYVVRIAIPFRSLRFSMDSAQIWGVALGRVIQRTNEEAYWPHITKRVKGFVPQFRTLDGLAQISPGRNVQLNPYSMLARARVFDEDIPGHLNQRDERIGTDAKMVVRDALTLDATVNPDFSQVETDDPQVTVNQRFEVQFPEKRPFFLENAGYFQTPVELLFSRRIVDPGVGLRATGKMGRWALGGLAMNDRAGLEDDDPAFGKDTWIGAVRVQRELGKESHVGFLATDREFLESWKYDRMFSLDGRWRAGDHVSLVGQVMRSENRAHEGQRLAGWGVLADLSWEGRHFDYAGKYDEFTPEFAAPLGFVKRVGYRRTKQSWEYTFRPKGIVTKYGPSLATSFLWDHATSRLLDREVEGQFTVELEGHTKLRLTRAEAFELFDGLEFRPHANQMDVGTEWLKWGSLEATYAWGTAVNHHPAKGLDPALGRAVEAEVGLTLRPTPRMKLSQSYVESTLRTRPGSVKYFTERQVREKLSYQFSRALSLRAIVDYKWDDFNTALVKEDDPRERKWAMDLLLTYLAHPGTALYVGYTDKYENLAIRRGLETEVVRSRSPDLSVGRQVFVKLSYLLRF